MSIEVKKPSQEELESLGVEKWPIWEKEAGSFVEREIERKKEPSRKSWGEFGPITYVVEALNKLSGYLRQLKKK